MKAPLLLCLCCAVAGILRGSPIPFSGSGTSGSIGPGETWRYSPPTSRQTDEYSWGIPGAGAGSTEWLMTQPVNSFEITFDLPKGVDIDPTLVLPCGSDFCSQEGNTFKPWTEKLISSNTILFTNGGAPLLTTSTSYFVDIFFTGTVTDAAFSGAWDPGSGTAVPEPDCVWMAPAGLLILAWIRRRRAKATAY